MAKAKAKAKATIHTCWGHHDTMIVNLRDWVSREIHNLRNDIAKEIPELNSSTSKMLKSAEDMNIQLFDLVRSIVDLAETQANKKKKSQTTTKNTETDDYADLDV